MRQAILDDENMNSERSLLLERSITPRSIIRNEYAASEHSCDVKSGVDICHIMEEEESIAGDDQVCLHKTECYLFSLVQFDYEECNYEGDDGEYQDWENKKENAVDAVSVAS